MTRSLSARQFYGLDRDSFGAELANVTQVLANKLAHDGAAEVLDQIELPLQRMNI